MESADNNKSNEMTIERRKSKLEPNPFDLIISKRIIKRRIVLLPWALGEWFSIARLIAFKLSIWYRFALPSPSLIRSNWESFLNNSSATQVNKYVLPTSIILYLTQLIWETYHANLIKSVVLKLNAKQQSVK